MEEYERTDLVITEFDTEDVIMTSGNDPSYGLGIYEGEVGAENSPPYYYFD